MRAAGSRHALRWLRIAAPPAPRRRAARAASAAAAPPPPPTASLRLVATSPAATRLLASYFAADLAPGDAYLLDGGVGAGKSAFCRAFVRAAARDADLPVPSPTFTLQQTYDVPASRSGAAAVGEGGDASTSTSGREPSSTVPPLQIQHYDLYRLTAPGDLARLDLAAALPRAVALVEWAERLALAPGAAPPVRLALRLAVVGAGERAALERAGVAAGGGGEEDEEDDDGDEEGAGDARWRRLELDAAGGAWAARLAPLAAHVRARGPALGLWLDPLP
jgi:tRNA A37 threonylcarbamoyladenosine biosynthesis protein TsaE